MAPKAKNCRLVATSKNGAEIQLSILDHEEGFIYFNLSDTDKQRKDIQEYIKELQPKILSGVYDTQLVDMEKEEVCC